MRLVTISWRVLTLGVWCNFTGDVTKEFEVAGNATSSAVPVPSRREGLVELVQERVVSFFFFAA